MDEELITQAEEFVKQSFTENPHFSFGHWSVMYDHSVTVKNIALKIAEQVECDKMLIALGALLHDIGKTQKADENTLHYDHEKFNLPISRFFIDSLNLSASKKRSLKELISYASDSVEMKVIKDADALALYADKRLYMLYIEWAIKNGLSTSIQRKIDKFDKLRFPISKKIGEKWFEIMKRDWNLYMRDHNISA